MKISDFILLNLKIISKIPENGRIKRTESGVLAIDDSTSFVWLRRFIYGDSRKKAIKDINDIIDSSIDKCSDILNSKYFENDTHDVRDSFILKKLDDEYTKQYDLLNTIYTDLNDSIKGLINLRTTYHDDIISISKLDIIISKIKNQLVELDKVKKSD